MSTRLWQSSPGRQYFPSFVRKHQTVLVELRLSLQPGDIMGDGQTLPQDYPRTDGHSFQTDWEGGGVGRDVPHHIWVWESKDNFVESTLSFHLYVGSRMTCRLPAWCGKGLFPLSHPAHSFSYFNAAETRKIHLVDYEHCWPPVGVTYVEIVLNYIYGNWGMSTI